MEIDNPFSLHHYFGPDYFCDREQETETLISALENYRNTLLLSPRRIGKSGLIHHVFHHLKEKNEGIVIFFDVYPASSVAEFNDLLLTAITKAITAGKVNKVIKVVSDFFSSLRPNISFDPFSGAPSVTLQSSNEEENSRNLIEIFEILRNQKKIFYLAFDEFQQICTFENNRIEAILRTEIQKSSNLRFIFSGSIRHLLLPMFNDANRPFYGSCDTLELQKIDTDTYVNFIFTQFEKRKRNIDLADATYLVSWCAAHTYYVQALCNRIFSTGSKKITKEVIQSTLNGILREQDAFMQNLKMILKGAPNQWDLFKAISLEGKVSSVTSKDFMYKYRLASSAAVVGALQALIEKELIYSNSFDADGKALYESYNPFFANWFKYR